ncbi:MAG TPA: hypothetical protein VIQ05_16055 [Tardiphaga sp.]
MTLSRPMFPPVADRANKTSSVAEQVSTHASVAGVEPSSGNGTGSEPLNGVFETPFPTAAAPVDGDLYVRTDISPENLFQALERLRSEAGAEIERLLDFLDSLDDPDIEPSGDELDPSGDEREPELGSVEGRKGFDQSTWSAGDDMVDGGEPSLGAPERSAEPHAFYYGRKGQQLRTADGSQIYWAAGSDDGREGGDGSDDREGDELAHGGESEQEDDEPSLGWTAAEAARGRVYAGSMGSPDLEESCEDEGVIDSGIADYDGYMEQWPALFDGSDVRVMA